MAINSILQFSAVAGSSAGGDEQNFIGVAAPAGKTLAPGEVLRMAVMTALGTSDGAQADEFIRENNLTAPKEISVFRQGNQVIYQYPADAKFFIAAEEFKQKASANKAEKPPENISNLQTRNFQANQMCGKLTAPVAVPAKLVAAYKNYLQQKGQPDSQASRQDFLREVRQNPQSAAKYHPLFGKTAAQSKLENQSRQIEAANSKKADSINSGYNLRFGKTARQSTFSVATEKEYQIARTVYQAADTEEFARAFKDGKLSNAGRIFNAYYAKGIEENFGKQNPLLYGDYRSQTADRNTSAAQIIFKNLNPEEQSMLASAEFQRAQKTGSGNVFAPSTVGQGEAIKQGLDGRNGTYYYSTDGLKDLADPRREVFQRVLTVAGYDEVEAKTYLDNLEKRTGEITYRWIGASDYDANKDGIVQAEEELAFDRDAAKNPVGRFTLSSGERNKIVVDGALAKGDKQKAFEVYSQNFRREAERDFDKNKTGNILVDGFAAQSLHRRMNEHLDETAKRMFAAGDDFRISDNPFQTGANQTADQIEKDTRDWIEAVPFLKSLSPENKTRIVDFRIGEVRGVMQLAASADGIVRFVPDLVRDGLVYSLKQSGMDTSAYETVIAGEKKLHADFFNAYAALNTKSLAREEYVYQVKNDLNIRTSVFDLPSFSRSVGEMVPQAIPQLALAVATDGMSLGAQVAINASVGAGMAGGQAYARTGSHIKATEEAFWGGINGGMIPLGNKLNLVGDVSLQIGATVLQGKIRGVPDNEIIDQMMKQAGGAIAFRVGTKLNEGLAKLRGKESVSIDEAKHILFEETQTALKEGNVKYSEALQKLANETGTKIEIGNGKVKIEKVLTPKEVSENSIKSSSRKFFKDEANPTDSEIAVFNKTILLNEKTVPSEQSDFAKVKTNAAERQDFKDSFDATRYNKYSSEISSAKMSDPSIRSIPNEDLVAIKGYTSDDYGALNKALRTADKAGLNKLKPYVLCAVSGLNQLPSFEGTVFRGIDLNSLPKILRKYRAGSTVTELSFSSSSDARASAFDKDTMMIIKSKNGKDVSFLSEFPNEKEILFRPQTKLFIEKVYMDKISGKRIIEAKEVD